MINQVTLLGRLARDVETREVGEGFVSTFTLAVNKDEKEAMFIPCRMFNKTDKLSKYLTKGKKIAIAGTINQESYKDKKDENHSIVYVFVKYLEFAESKAPTEER